MANPFIGVRIPPDLEAAIAQRMQVTGQSKSDIVIDALRTYLGLKHGEERLAEIEERLTVLESLADQAESQRQHGLEAAPASEHRG
ncbi:ribbon-helix-helix protein, CopG family [Synechococcales cyanobacterium C]|uniref:Ribbon-helix-helix protein, CopG family n=1 Tax=Petrachloros mirabilis ULC683 TaxID=2781853 RepID=A0A8K2A1K7_9CYAN|nr:ribbon-helix-helix protein, CopG family [Petrachloros mirabilis]NCJ07988.1 ribbon-helix-helix protein, CopG family [Petrachloros mirabilis ULC683]